MFYRSSSVEADNTKCDKKRLRTSLDLITQTLKENKERADKQALEAKLSTDRQVHIIIFIVLHVFHK